MAEFAAPGAALLYLADNLPTADTYNKGRRVCLNSTNDDLYRMLCEHLDSKSISLEVRWIPSHLDTEPTKVRPDWATDDHIAVNVQVDRLATLAAELSDKRLDNNDVIRVTRYTKIIKKFKLGLHASWLIFHIGIGGVPRSLILNQLGLVWIH